ncbi:hypothetical protein BLOT_006299 [Blomia tropicalis]|nr:hypothetical protein BLOT_006299 [Blomia tropicalis]
MKRTTNAEDKLHGNIGIIILRIKSSFNDDDNDLLSHNEHTRSTSFSPTSKSFSLHHISIINLIILLLTITSYHQTIATRQALRYHYPRDEVNYSLSQDYKPVTTKRTSSSIFTVKCNSLFHFGCCYFFIAIFGCSNEPWEDGEQISEKEDGLNWMYCILAINRKALDTKYNIEHLLSYQKLTFNSVFLSFHSRLWSRCGTQSLNNLFHSMSVNC